MAALEDAPQIPGQLTVDDCIREAEDELRSSVRGSEIPSEKSEAPVFTNVTPSGLEVAYSPSPRRHYKIRKPRPEGWTISRATGFSPEWEEIPSVTTVLGCLEKPLAWWGMTVGVQGVLELSARGILQAGTNQQTSRLVVDASGGEVSAEDVVRFLTQEKLTVNHTLTKAGDRGTSVHDAFEEFCLNETWPHPEVYPESEQPYIEGLRKFLTDWVGHGVEDIQTEVMVGSLAHKFAGRYDMRCKWNGGPMVVKTYPKKANKIEELPAGRYLIDVKTSSGVYKSHSLQLAAYQGASDECGYEPVDYTAVLHLTKTGEYELVVTTATLDDFLSIRATYEMLKNLKVGS